MRAVQSSSTAGMGISGVWCRTEQFAALRYVSRYLVTDAVVGSSLGASKDYAASAESKASPVGAGWDGAILGEAGPFRESANWDISALARNAGALLLAMQFCNGRLADKGLSFSDWTRYSEELEWLRTRSLALMEEFLRGLRERNPMASSRFRETTPQAGTDGQASC